MSDRARRILFVPPRYGEDISGGAERLMRWMAEASRAAGCDVQIATTCARDHETWANALPEGRSVENGIPVHRFRVTPRDERRHHHLVAKMMAEGQLSELDATDLMATSIWSEGLQRFLDDHGAETDVIVLAPYLFGTTFWGAQSWPEKTIVVPCLHDEPFAYLAPVQRMLRRVARLSFNAPGEAALAERLLGPVQGAVVGMGLDAREHPPSNSAPPSPLAAGEYFVYAGRVEQGKRVHIAAEYVAALARSRGTDQRLAILGSGSWEPPPELRRYVTMLGFVSEEQKRAVMAGAIALVNPSELESFSIVLMESWLQERPVLVAEGSDVLRDHCARSAGGFAFRDQESFIHAASFLLDDRDTATAMGAKGRQYVLAEYEPAVVTQRFLALVDEVVAAGR